MKLVQLMMGDGLDGWFFFNKEQAPAKTWQCE